jgi:hypothetical protein
MIFTAPSNAGEIRRRGRGAIVEDILHMTECTNNYFHGGTNTAAVLMTTNTNTTAYCHSNSAHKNMVGPICLPQMPTTIQTTETMTTLIHAAVTITLLSFIHAGNPPPEEVAGQHLRQPKASGLNCSSLTMDNVNSLSNTALHLRIS